MFPTLVLKESTWGLSHGLALIAAEAASLLGSCAITRISLSDDHYITRR